MKNKLFITIFVTALSLGFSEPMSLKPELPERLTPKKDLSSSYSYFGVGLGPLPLPAITLSYGNRFSYKDSFGLDVGGTLATLVRFNALRGYVNGLVYSNQVNASRFYMGMGVSVGMIGGIEKFVDGVFSAPNFLFGREFYNAQGEKRIFQAEVLYPLSIKDSWRRHSEVLKEFPLVTVKYGLAF